jgi:hypothetical protein
MHDHPPPIQLNAVSSNKWFRLRYYIVWFARTAEANAYYTTSSRLTRTGRKSVSLASRLYLRSWECATRVCHRLVWRDYWLLITYPLRSKLLVIFDFCSQCLSTHLNYSKKLVPIYEKKKNQALGFRGDINDGHIILWIKTNSQIFEQKLTMNNGLGRIEY